MSAQDKLAARFGANVMESMGAGRQAGAMPAPPAAHGPAFRGGTEKYQGAARIKDALSIEVGRLAPDPDQPRKEFDPEALAQLAASMKARGQLQPIRVRWDGDDSRWVIVAGERRWRAARIAGLTSLVCVEAKGPLTPDDILEDQLVENCLREDLKPVEQAKAFKALIDRRSWSYRQLGEHLNIAPSSIARALALLELPESVQAKVEEGALPPATAYELSRVEDPAARAELAGRVVAEGLTRQETAAAVKASKPAAKGKGRGAGKAKVRKVTAAVFRTANAHKVIVECRRGVDDTTAEAALEEALGQIRSRKRADAQEAA